MSPDNEVFVSAPSVWEIAIKTRPGKRPGIADLVIDIVDMVRRSGFLDGPSA
jgi:PIN domain nuclease of toxin-antitoxin system